MFRKVALNDPPYSVLSSVDATQRAQGSLGPDNVHGSALPQGRPRWLHPHRFYASVIEFDAYFVWASPCVGIAI